MTPKYRADCSEIIHSLSPRYNITKQPLFKIETEKIDQYDTDEIHVSQLPYLIPDHTHYCLNCKHWYPSKQSVFECKIEHATITHNEHVIYCV
jgi:hypothetical protein